VAATIPQNGAVVGASRQRKKGSFLKERTKELLFLLPALAQNPLCDRGPAARIKVFLLLFLQKKKTLSSKPS
jgi:hypothetical protein